MMVMQFLPAKLFILLFAFGHAAAVTPQREILLKLLEDYDINEWPDAENEEPTDVHVQVFINSFGSLNAANMDYSVDMFLRQRWQDKRLQNSRDKKITIRDLEMQNKIWKPDTYFHNVKDAELHTVTMPNILFRINSTGHVLYSMRITTKLSCNMEFKYYPFDTQECGILISAYANTNDLVKYHWLEKMPIDLPDDLEIAQFEFHGSNTKETIMNMTTGTYSALTVEFKLSRQNGYHILQTYIPTIMIVSISWVSFWLDPNSVPGRVSIGVTTLLTLTTLASGIRQQLPPVSYIKAIDVWVGMCMIMVFGALLEFTLANWLANTKVLKSSHSELKKEDPTSTEPPKTYITEARWLDRISRALFPASFIIFNAVYWPYYLSDMTS